MTAAKKILDEKFLKTLVPLGDMDPEPFNQLPAYYNILQFETGEKLFTSGDLDNQTYWLITGQVSIDYKGGKTQTITANTTQARYALAPNKPRQATAIARSPVTLLSLDSDLLDTFINWNGGDGYQVSDIDGIESEDNSDWMTRFLQSKVFLKLPAQNIQALMMRLDEMHTQTGQIIIRQGDDDGYYYIIKKGSCSVTRKHSPQDDERELAVLGVGAGFGEEAIITNNRRGASVTMLEKGCLMRLTRNDFNQLLVEPLIQAVNYYDVANNTNNIFLDVRPYDDYLKDGITGSQNIILTQLRPNIKELNNSMQYVVCSNTGSRAAAAAFLLCQQGIDAIVLRYGLENLPDDVSRGNQEIEYSDDIPLVNNVVSFLPIENRQGPIIEKIEVEKIDGSSTPATAEPKKLSPVDVKQDPAIRALFSKAQQRVKREAQKAADAEIAKYQAQQEVLRLKTEADKARKEAEEARLLAESVAKESAEKARTQASREAARLREIELGAKHAEMEEAVRQAEEEAKRAHDAATALKHAELEIAELKTQMQLAIAHSEEEARKSKEAIEKFTDEHKKQQQAEAKKLAEEHARQVQEVAEAKRQLELQAQQQQLESQRIAEENSRQVREFAEAKKRAELEAQRLKTETDQIRKQYEEELKQTAEKAKLEAQLEINRIRSAELEKKRDAKEKAAQEAVLQAKRAKIAEEARLKAEAEILNIKKQAEEEQFKAQQDINKQLEKARAEALQAANQLSVEQQEKVEATLKYAQEQAQRVKEAEAAKAHAEQEAERIKLEAEEARKKMQEQLTSDIARSEIEHEVARARALELANKQAEIDDISRKASEEAERAQQAEQAKKEAQEEIYRLKAEIEAVRNNEISEKPRENETTSGFLESELQRVRDDEVAKIRAEIELVSKKAEKEAARARLAEEEHQKSHHEIERLKAEIVVATMQAQAQLKADAEHAQVESVTFKQRAKQIESMQQAIEEAARKAEFESDRARNAEKALLQAEYEVSRFRNSEQTKALAQQEVERLRAEQTANKQIEIEAARLKAKEEARRAQHAEKEKLIAENEIRRLKAQAKEQRVKAEKVLQQTIDAARKEVDHKLVRLRAAEKAVKAMGKDLHTNDMPNAKDAAGKNVKERTNSVAKKIPEKKIALPNSKLKPKPIPKQKTQTSHWISDQVMWETTLGIREDEDAAKYISPDMEVEQSKHYISNEVIADEPLVQTKKHATFTVRDVNPYVNTQDVTEYVDSPRRGGIGKIVLIILGCIVLGAGAYYVTMGKDKRSQLRETVSSDSTINTIKSTVNEKLGNPVETDQNTKPMSIEERAQKNKAKTDRIRLQRKNVDNEYKTTLSKETRPRQKSNSVVRENTPKVETVVRSAPAPVAPRSQANSSNSLPVIAPQQPEQVSITVVNPLPQDNSTVDTSSSVSDMQNDTVTIGGADSAVSPGKDEVEAVTSKNSYSATGGSSLPIIADVNANVPVEDVGDSIPNSDDSTTLKIDENLNVVVDAPIQPLTAEIPNTVE